MNSEFKEIIDFVEEELLLIEELLELVLIGSNLHFVLDSKKDAYKKILNFISSKNNKNEKLVLVNN